MSEPSAAHSADDEVFLRECGDVRGQQEVPAEVLDGGSYTWRLPAGFPVPKVPEDNPMSQAKVELGRYLFYDERLSHDQSMSCASCHHQRFAFTDGRKRSTGTTGQLTPRSAMSLANVAYASSLTWANPTLLDLEHQALVPMFGEEPIELGLGSEAGLERRLRTVALYENLFARAFPDEQEPISTQNVVRALASFERTLISGSTPFDRYLYGNEKDAVSESAKRGYALINAEKLECHHCHSGFDFTDHVDFEGRTLSFRPYHNTGLYNIDGKGGYPEPNTGVHAVTGQPRDMGRFKAPTLRNVALTAPYMHDGSIEDLDGVLDHYVAAGRTIESGPNRGVGASNPLKSVLLKPFELSEDERKDVLEFLSTLTDCQFLTDPRFSDPWPRERAREER